MPLYRLIKLNSTTTSSIKIPNSFKVSSGDSQKDQEREYDI
jgi:hypothetical protein